MNTEKFWSMIENAREESRGNDDKQIRILADTLLSFSIEEIQEFERILWTMMAQAYRADLWEAASLVACGCSDDGFHEFRGWLIAQGQIIFEKVLKDPEAIADMVDKKQRFYIFEGRMTSVAEEAYEQKTGQPMLDGGYPEKVTLVGRPLRPYSERPAKYPRIMSKLGECHDDDWPK